MHLYYSNNFWKAPWKSSCVSMSMTFIIFHLLNGLIMTASEVKATGSKVCTIGRVRNCLDANLGQIVCDKDGVVDWCIVLVEMPLSRFEVLASSDGISSWRPLKPQHSNPYSNPNPLANQLWCSDSLTHTPLIIPNRLPA